MVLRRRPEKSSGDGEENNGQELTLQQVIARLNAFDSRLDNIDSMVTAVAERVMSRPLVVNVTCPHCGKNTEIALIGTQKPTR